MTLLNGNIFRVTDPLCGEFTGHRGALVFPFICAWINGWVNNRVVGDLRRHRGHCDVIVMRMNENMFRFCRPIGMILYRVIHFYTNIWTITCIAYTFQENWDFVLIIIVQFMMSANSRTRYGLQIVFVCLYITLSHYHHCVNLSVDIELMKCLPDIFCRVCG